MDLRKLKTLIDLVSESNISELEITEAEGKVRIVKAGPAVAVAAPMYAPPAPVAAPAPVAVAPVAAPAAAGPGCPGTGGRAVVPAHQAGGMAVLAFRVHDARSAPCPSSPTPA